MDRNKKEEQILIEDYIFYLHPDGDISYEYMDGTRIYFNTVNPIAIQLYHENKKYWAGVVTKEALYRFQKGFDNNLQIIGLAFENEINAVKAAGLLLRLIKGEI